MSLPIAEVTGFVWVRVRVRVLIAFEATARATVRVEGGWSADLQVECD